MFQLYSFIHTIFCRGLSQKQINKHDRQTCYIIKQKGYNIKKNCFSFAGKNGDTLASLHYAKLMESVVTCAVLELEVLPPTECAMYCYSLRIDLFD